MSRQVAQLVMNICHHMRDFEDMIREGAAFEESANALVSTITAVSGTEVIDMRGVTPLTVMNALTGEEHTVIRVTGDRSTRFEISRGERGKVFRQDLIRKAIAWINHRQGGSNSTCLDWLN